HRGQIRLAIQIGIEISYRRQIRLGIQVGHFRQVHVTFQISEPGEIILPIRARSRAVSRRIADAAFGVRCPGGAACFRCRAGRRPGGCLIGRGSGQVRRGGVLLCRPA
ncbi:MAG TPA: hypothetical protein VN840_09795, partial [Streptosporangiaceae bacterium]|nr:hypothetical protein [Streptosporangiaceae bacterium]